MYKKIKQYGTTIIAAMISSLLFLTCITAVYLGSNSYFSSATKEEMVIMYDEELLIVDQNWRISIVDEELEEKGVIKESGTIPCMIPNKKGEIISITSYLPRSMVEGTYLRIQSIKAYVDVYVEGELIYSGGRIHLGSREEKTMPLDRWNLVEMKPEYSEKEIRITYRSPYAFFQGILPEVTLGSYSESLLYSSSAGSLSVYLAICIIAVGVVTLLIAIIHNVGSNTHRSYAYLGIFIILMGFMFICQANVPRTTAAKYYQDFVLENVTFRLGQILYAVYLYSKCRGRWRQGMGALAGGLSILFVCSVYLHFSGNADFNETLLFSSVTFVLLLLLGLWNETEAAQGVSLRYRMAAGTGTLAALAVFLWGVGEPVHFFATGLNHTFIISFLIYSVFLCVALIMNSYDYAMDQVRTAEELNRTKIRLMVSQIQPHFIHNTLNTIRAMVLIEPKRAADLILHFSNYLRYNLDSLDRQDRISFSEELKHIKEYTAIQCERFHRIRVHYEIEEADFEVPPLSVQIFVENAIKHGVCRKEGGGSVTVSSKKDNEGYVVEILDDGVGFDTGILKEQPEEHGIGIKNAMYRLQELANADVTICSAPGQGCRVRVTFPIVEGKEETDENHISG